MVSILEHFREEYLGKITRKFPVALRSRDFSLRERSIRGSHRAKSLDAGLPSQFAIKSILS